MIQGIDRIFLRCIVPVAQVIVSIGSTSATLALTLIFDSKSGLVQMCLAAMNHTSGQQVNPSSCRTQGKEVAVEIASDSSELI